jgi:hypothetical protein
MVKRCVVKRLNALSALPLLVAGIAANHTNRAFAADHFAIFAKLLN